MAEETAARDRLRKTGLVAGATLASRVLGFVRDMAVAMALGAGPLADAFFVAFRIPEALRRLLGEGTFSMAVAPSLAETKAHAGDEAMFALARGVLVWAALLFGPLTLGCMLWPEPLVRVIAPGFANTPELLHRTALLLSLCMPYLLTTLAAGVCISLLHVQGRFLAPALSPCLLNVVLISAAGAGMLAGADVGICLALGLVLAGIGQTLMQWPALRQEGAAWAGPVSLRGPGPARVGRALLPAMLGASAFQLMLMLASFRGTSLGVGTASALYYADRLVQFPLGVAGVAVSTVALPELASLHARGEQARFADTVRQAVRLSLFLSLPATAGLWLLAEPVVAVLFGRGAFGDESVLQTATMLQWLTCALPGLALVRPLLAATYAAARHRVAVFAGLGGVAAFCILEGLLEHWLGPLTPALALGGGVWVQAALLARWSLPLSAKADVPWLVRLVGLCLAMGVLILWGQAMLPDSPVAQIACIPLWAGAFLLGALAMRMPEVSPLLKRFQGKQKGAA
ncbi:murein biosynthesis integral membrane protein MurJ [Megalodesulfovibrio paquesii]